ncbi:MAG TPA: YihY/virulence factor BrkB family protein [Candidatus Saccharimonadales bacterium]|nr:YihY/virulence factor BrkB family protein [Candidatus Saccharimonadales bacterium]
MNFIQKAVAWVDRFQQRHTVPGFLYAVIKKQGDDQGGYQTALLAYYAFWSLFPLLIVFTTVTQLLLSGNPGLRNDVSNSVTHYFPILGNHLQQSVQASGKTGVALGISLLLTLYGARGVANAFQHTVNHIWRVPQAERPGFPKNLLKSLALIGAGGLGLVGASVVAGFATGGSHILWLRIVSMVLSALLLFVIFVFLFRVSLAKNVEVRELVGGAVVAALGLTLLQVAGGFVVTHELKNLNSLYGSFAVTLGLLFWLSLQAQVIVYALEVNTVRAQKLWPRSLVGDEPTEADKRAQRLRLDEPLRQEKAGDPDESPASI